MKEKNNYYISFYSEKDGLFKETLRCEAPDAVDTRMHTKAKKKGEELGADYYHCFLLVPRRFYIPKDD
jgi:hypothetical protein